MLINIVETIRKIRCFHHRDGKSIRQIARDLHLSRNTVKQAPRSEATEFTHQRSVQPMPKLGLSEETLLTRLEADRTWPRREQRTAMRLFEGLQQEGSKVTTTACGAVGRSGAMARPLR